MTGAGGREWMFVHGPADGPQVLVVPPLFEELNFTRATVVAMARGLAARGIGAWIIDLPGTGESVRAIDGVRLADWRDAVAAAAARIGSPHVASLRGGALIDDAAAGAVLVALRAGRWRGAAPPDGAGAGDRRSRERSAR